jgi:hypothetical protein
MNPGIGHWGFWIEDFGFGGNDRFNIKCSIPNPQWAGSWEAMRQFFAELFQ